MSDLTNPNPASPPASPPAASSTPQNPSEGSAGTAPDGRAHTAITEQPQSDAPDPAKAGEETKEKTEAQATPFDAEKLTFPEGFEKDPTLLGQFGELAKSANVSHEAAQQFIDLHANAMKAASEKSTQQWSQVIQAWENEIKADKDIGGEKWTGVQEAIGSLIHDPRFATPGFVEALNITGFGSHPAAARFFSKIAKILSEGSAVQGNPPGSQGQPKSLAQAMYPHNPSEAR